MWQQQIMQQAPETVQMRQFRDRLSSSPELPLQQTPQTITPTGLTPPTHGHSRGQSQPLSSHNLHLPTETTHLHAPTISPKAKALSGGTHSTPDFCSTPLAPVSPMTAATQPKVEVYAMFSGDFDPDYTDFSQFALDLWTEQFGIDDFIAVDEFTSVSW